MFHVKQRAEGNSPDSGTISFDVDPVGSGSRDQNVSRETGSHLGLGRSGSQGISHSSRAGDST